MLPSRRAGPEGDPALSRSDSLLPPSPRFMSRISRPAVIGAATLLATLLLAPPVGAQGADPPRPDGFRVGLTLGGTGFIGVAFEYLWGDWSSELTVGTLGFSDLSVSLAGKHYLSDGRFRPAVGVGFWNLTVWSEEGSGNAFLLRAPIAVEWRISDAHALGLEVGLNRALSIRRVDPADERPPRPNLVPLPAIYYRYGSPR